MPSPPYKMSSKSTNRFKSCIHLRSLNIRHFGMVEATAMNSRSRCYLQCHQFLRRFHPNPPIDSKVITGFLYTHLRSLNVRHFGMAEDTRFKNMSSRSSSMASPAYKMSWKSTHRFKSYYWGTHRQAGDLISLLSFSESRLIRKTHERLRTVGYSWWRCIPVRQPCSTAMGSV
jgi:hypothetical protein